MFVVNMGGSPSAAKGAPTSSVNTSKETFGPSSVTIIECPLPVRASAVQVWLVRASRMTRVFDVLSASKESDSFWMIWPNRTDGASNSA